MIFGYYVDAPCYYVILLLTMLLCQDVAGTCALCALLEIVTTVTYYGSFSVHVAFPR